MGRPLSGRLHVAHHWRVTGTRQGGLTRRCEKCESEQSGAGWRWFITRATTCKVKDHLWASVAYPGTEHGRFMRCLRCAKEDHSGGSDLVPFM